MADNTNVQNLQNLQEQLSNSVAEKKSTYHDLKKFYESHGRARMATQSFKLKDGSGEFTKQGIGFGNTFCGIAMSVNHNRVKDANGETLKDANGKTVWEPNELTELDHKALCLHILSHADEYQVLEDARVTLQDGSNPYSIVPKNSFTDFGEELD
jgi:hypothetical protein